MPTTETVRRRRLIVRWLTEHGPNGASTIGRMTGLSRNQVMHVLECCPWVSLKNGKYTVNKAGRAALNNGDVKR